MVRVSSFVWAASLPLLFAACTSATPPKPPGTYPEDIDYQGHCLAANQHERKALELEREAAAGPVAAQRRELRDRARREHEIAEQQEWAALQVREGAPYFPGSSCIAGQSTQPD